MAATLTLLKLCIFSPKQTQLKIYVFFNSYYDHFPCDVYKCLHLKVVNLEVQCSLIKNSSGDLILSCTQKLMTVILTIDTWVQHENPLPVQRNGDVIKGIWPTYC